MQFLKFALKDYNIKLANNASYEINILFIQIIMIINMQ